MADQPSTRTLSVSDLNTDITKDEPRIQDVRLGKRLGFSRSRKIRDLITNNESELLAYGSLAPKRGKSRGQEYAEYWLNEAQALLLCMFARTGKAAEVRKEVIEVYLAVRHGQAPQIAARAPAALPAPPTLTNAQARTLQKMIRERWSDSKDREAAYERLKDRFDVPKYRRIARADYDEARAFIESERAPRTVALALPIADPEANPLETDADKIAAALHLTTGCQRRIGEMSDRLDAVSRELREFHDITANLYSRMEYVHYYAGPFLAKPGKRQ